MTATLLGPIAQATADPQTISIPGATAGRDVIVFATASALLDPGGGTPGWTRDVNATPGNVTVVYRLPAASNPGGTLTLILDLNAARPVAGVAVEGYFTDALAYGSLDTRVPVGHLLGTGAHTIDGTGRTLFAVFSTEHLALGTLDLVSLDQGFTELGDSGLVDGGGNPDARLWVGQADGVSFTADGVVATFNADPPGGGECISGFAAYTTRIPPAPATGDAAAQARRRRDCR